MPRTVKAAGYDDPVRSLARAVHPCHAYTAASATPEGRSGASSAADEMRGGGGGDSFFATLWHAFRSLLGLEDEAKKAFFKEGDRLAKGESA